MDLSPQLSPLDRFFAKHGQNICTIIALSIPLKLTWTYSILLPILLTWLIAKAPGLRASLESSKSLARPLSFLIVLFIVSSIAGIDFVHSLRPLFSLLGFAITIFFFARYSKFWVVALALTTGQAIAGFHSIVDSGFPDSVPGIFLGKVTESGQISITLFLALALGMAFLKFGSLRESGVGGLQHLRIPPFQHFKFLGLAVGTSLLLFAVGFSDSYGFSYQLRFLLLAAALVVMIGQNIVPIKLTASASRWGRFVITTALPLISVALLVNLKRGPWLGTAVSMVVAMVILAPRFVPLALAAVSLLAVSVPPIRERLAESYEHFTITGGRQVIWEVGGELAVRYPLGIGFQNSPVLREYSSEIPPELRHFHNNFLNILVEAGSLGLGAFLWLIISVVRLTFRRQSELSSPDAILTLGVCLGIISWQVAGLVEYNFGDTEVLLVFISIIGAYFANRSPSEDRALSSGSDSRIDRGLDTLNLAIHG